MIAAAKRYFAGEETDFSGVRLDLADKDPLFAQIYEAVRRIRWGRTTTYGAGEAYRRRSRGCARRRNRHG